MINITIPFILLPLYIYPAGHAWKNIYRQIETYPDLTFDIVINVNSGPGPAASNHPSSEWNTGISTLHRYNNTRLLGYVHVSQATRNYSYVTADIDTWASWATYTAHDIAMDGIFFDESPDTNTTSALTYMKNATTYARQRIANSTSNIVFNAGTTVSDDFYDIADYIVASETPYADNFSTAISSISPSVAPKSIVLLYHYTGTVSEQTTTVNNLVDAGISGIFISTSADYYTVSSDWSQFCAAVNRASGGAVASTSSSPSTMIPSATLFGHISVSLLVVLCLYFG